MPHYQPAGWPRNCYTYYTTSTTYYISHVVTIQQHAPQPKPCGPLAHTDRAAGRQLQSRAPLL